MSRLLVVGLAFTGLLASATSQSQMWRVEGVGDQLARGAAMLAIGDVNGDGWDDLVEMVAVRTSPGTWCCGTGATAITSGRDGSILSIAPPLGLTTREGFSSESLARTGDMDRDGIPDYAYLRWDAYLAGTQEIVVRSGFDHHVIWSQSQVFGSDFGFRIAGNMDLDGDGQNDIVTCDTRAGPYGTLYAYSNSGALLYQIANQNPNVLVGVDVAALGGDLDNDGCDEFLVACTEVGYRGAILVVSGRTGTILRTCYGELPGDYLYFVTGCGDIDGDGVPDIAGGAHDQGNDCVTTFSGATGQVIHSYRSRSISRGTHSAMGPYLEAKDLDHDGINDIIAGAAPFLFALNGRTGDEMFAFSGASGPPSGWIPGIGRFTVLDPPPTEVYPILVYSEGLWYSYQNNGVMLSPGLIWGFRTSPPTATTYGFPTSSTGSPPRMGMRDLPGAATRFTLSSAKPGSIALFTLGISNQQIAGLPLPVSLAPVGFPGITLETSSDVVVFALTGTNGIQGGYAQIDVGLDLVPTGYPLYAQWLWFDPSNTSLHGSTLGHAFRAR